MNNVLIAGILSLVLGFFISFLSRNTVFLAPLQPPEQPPYILGLIIGLLGWLAIILIVIGLYKGYKARKLKLSKQ